MPSHSEPTNAAATPRFTEGGAECRKQHVEGYTGPICSCGPTECKASREHSENERFDPVASAASGDGSGLDVRKADAGWEVFDRNSGRADSFHTTEGQARTWARQINVQTGLAS